MHSIISVNEFPKLSIIEFTANWQERFIDTLNICCFYSFKMIWKNLWKDQITHFFEQKTYIFGLLTFMTSRKRQRSLNICRKAGHKLLKFLIVMKDTLENILESIIQTNDALIVLGMRFQIIERYKYLWIENYYRLATHSGFARIPFVVKNKIFLWLV